MEAIEFYSKYADTLKDPDEHKIIMAVIDILRTVDTPEGLINKVFAAVPYDKSVVRKVLRKAARAYSVNGLNR